MVPWDLPGEQLARMGGDSREEFNVGFTASAPAAPFCLGWGAADVWPRPRSRADARIFLRLRSAKTSGYAIGADVFKKKLEELSKGTISINQYPGAQLGTEAQTLQKVQTGDIDFVLLSTANASTAQPESGVFSIHFIFRDDAHAVKVLTDPTVIAAMRELYATKVKGAHMLTLASQGLRHMYGKKEIRKSPT